MAFNKAFLNNIAGSCGRSNVWVYDHTGENCATITAANYFANTAQYGVRLRDTMIIAGSDGTTIRKMNSLTETTSSLTKLIDMV